MMDYQLFAISEDPDDGELIIEPVDMSDNPEETGGLFTFTAQAGMRYVLIYSRAYRIYFINNKEEPKYRYHFKVRRGEAPGSGAYSFEYDQVEIPIDSFINSEGIEFTYIGWSYREDRLKEFDPDKEIKRKTYVYAFYDDNSGEVSDARKQLEDAIKAAIEKSDDYFLTLKETEKIKEALEFAWKIVKHVKSNAIVLTGKDVTYGVGAGQMNRVGAADIAIAEAGEKCKGAVMSSDAFFPFGDTIEAAGKAGITAVIQPGGSIRDEESIEMADKYGITMVFTGHRHFRHS